MFLEKRSHICRRGTEPMIDTVEPIGIVGTGRVAQALGRLLTENGQPVAAIAGRNPERAAPAALFTGARTTPVTIEELPAHSSHVLIAVSG
jgi:predicted dinucleotide-binding enzyme